jgi:hypothetical protein
MAGTSKWGKRPATIERGNNEEGLITAGAAGAMRDWPEHRAIYEIDALSGIQETSQCSGGGSDRHGLRASRAALFPKTDRRLRSWCRGPFFFPQRPNEKDRQNCVNGDGGPEQNSRRTDDPDISEIHRRESANLACANRLLCVKQEATFVEKSRHPELPDFSCHARQQSCFQRYIGGMRRLD